MHILEGLMRRYPLEHRGRSRYCWEWADCILSILSGSFSTYPACTDRLSKRSGRSFSDMTDYICRQYNEYDDFHSDHFSWDLCVKLVKVGPPPALVSMWGALHVVSSRPNQTCSWISHIYIVCHVQTIFLVMLPVLYIYISIYGRVLSLHILPLSNRRQYLYTYVCFLNVCVLEYI